MKPCSVNTVTYTDAKMQQTRLGVKKKLGTQEKPDVPGKKITFPAENIRDILVQKI